MNDISSERPASQATCSSPTGQAALRLVASRGDQARGSSALRELADRCEKATGQATEIDFDIALALFPQKVLRHEESGWRDFSEVLRVTGSTDDAILALLSQRLGYIVGTSDESDKPMIHADAFGMDGDPREGSADAATPALALCAAALRACASSIGGRSEQ